MKVGNYKYPEFKEELESGKYVIALDGQLISKEKADEHNSKLRITEFNPDDWCKYIAEWGKRKGWEFEEKDLPEKLMLVVTELAEAMEEYRNGALDVYFSPQDKPEGFYIECADAVIRIMHIFGKFGISMNELLEMKMAYNEKRPYRHGDKRA